MKLIERAVLILAGLTTSAVAQAQNSTPQHQHQTAPAAQGNAAHSKHGDGQHGRGQPGECPCCRMMMQRHATGVAQGSAAAHRDHAPAHAEPKPK